MSALTPDNEWTDLDWSWDELFDGDEVVVDEAVACSLENPEICESCS